MVSTRSQIPHANHVTDSARNLRRELTIVRDEERSRAIPHRGMVLHENLGDTEVEKLRSGYRANHCAPVETARDEKDVLVPVPRSREEIPELGEIASLGQSRKGVLITAHRSV